MDTIHIVGGRRLSGTIPISGAKNAALTLLPCALLTDEELRELDRFVRNNTTERFGPVRAVAPKLVVEVAFEGVNRSTRHKSGVAMRFPRVARIRWDKPVAEADRLETLEAMIDAPNVFAADATRAGTRHGRTRRAGGEVAGAARPLDGVGTPSIPAGYLPTEDGAGEPPEGGR